MWEMTGGAIKGKQVSGSYFKFTPYGRKGIVLVSFCDDYYQANSKDMMYNIKLIAAACGISMVLLDHIAIEPDGYYSYRDNGLLTYLSN